ncbi:Protein TAR1 [Capsicum baccatum]|uniref:Protein TAR1 n=1 Tax=Capsicum baccatum TaxID=33114 RepID=A0A2G2V9A5_CAPBA|nr:Protein TAR1 [Capsicum baccatum]
MAPRHHGTMAPRHRGTMAHWHRGTVAPWHPGTAALCHQRIAAQRHRDIMAPRHQGNKAARHQGTVAPWHRGTNAALHHGTTAPWHQGTKAPWHHGTQAPRHRGTIAPWHHGTQAPWHRGTMAHRHQGTVAPWHTGTKAPRHYGTVAPWHTGTMAPCNRGTQVCSHSNPFQKIKVDWRLTPRGHPTNQLPYALWVYSPVDSHTCQTPWFVFQNGLNEEPTSQRPQRTDVEARRRRAMPSTIEETAFHDHIESSGFIRPPINDGLCPESIGRPARRHSTSDRGALPAPIRFSPDNLKHSLTLFSKSFSSFPRGTCSLSVSHPYLYLDGIHRPIWATFPNNLTHRQRLVRVIPPNLGSRSELLSVKGSWSPDARRTVTAMAKRVELPPPLAATSVDVNSHLGARGAREASICPATTAHPVVEARCEGGDAMRDSQADVPSA